jgi:hypothetical protein
MYTGEHHLARSAHHSALNIHQHIFKDWLAPAPRATRVMQKVQWLITAICTLMKARVRKWVPGTFAR